MAMKFLLASCISAIVTYVFVSISLFTPAWVSAKVSAFGLSAKKSAGIFPWGCVSANTCSLFWNNADGWAIVLFLSMLFAWIVQFFAVVSIILAVVIQRYRCTLTRGFVGKQTLVTILLLFTLIGYGATYDRSAGVYFSIGVTFSLDSSYWLCLVATIFSIVAMGFGGTTVKQARHCEWR
ncbi:hypothetical protein RB195_026178 [Necator americanus]|uniref:Uncharacterized protein n=2 Tax=Necator americanus TaxID=51031 RepID=A0ABR1EW01_NECAM|nr:hypothetical protein NECAME_07074 [Necator americanus]ETN84047.1 hypothetical protein NECAME_07074 [Necator americanus]